MALDDLLERLEQVSGTSGTADVSAAVPASPLPALSGTAGTAGTAQTVTEQCVFAHIWLLHFLDRNPLKVLTAPPASHDQILADYPAAVAAEPLAPIKPEPPALGVSQSCRTCRHCKRPGRADPGYCGGGRDDLPDAYGVNHPLRKLPHDGGASCANYAPYED